MKTLNVDRSFITNENELSIKKNKSSDYWRHAWEAEWQKSESQLAAIKPSPHKKQLVANSRIEPYEHYQNTAMIKTTVLTELIKSTKNLSNKKMQIDSLPIYSTLSKRTAYRSSSIDNGYIENYEQMSTLRQVKLNDLSSEIPKAFNLNHYTVQMKPTNLQIVNRRDQLEIWVRDYRADHNKLQKMARQLVRSLKEKGIALYRLIINGKSFYSNKNLEKK